MTSIFASLNIGALQANPAPNPTQRRKTLPTRMAVEEVAKEKTDGGGRRRD
jgi:hypothetical protein